MNQSKNNTIEIKSISELLGMHFFVPSFQRGYRWTEQQVTDLIDDINSFIPEKIDDEMTWYCMQPLVVRKMDPKDMENELFSESDREYVWYEVIDGQQRLTTIFIILNYLDSQKQTLKYATRSESETYLAKINQKAPADNIDFHFMRGAYSIIESYGFQNKSLFLQKLKYSTKNIFYEILDEDSYEVFKRLNSGKISLSNAELIKALLLNRDSFSIGSLKEIELVQLERAGEWDRIEQSLQDDDFWYFINPYANNPTYHATRIDFIFELMLSQNEDKTGNYPYRIGLTEYEKGKMQKEYFAFFKFSETIIHSKSQDACLLIWSDLQRVYRTIKSWYDNRELYHLIGYMINRKEYRDSNKKLRFLLDLLDQDRPKKAFLSYVKENCAKTLFLDKKSIDLDSLKYDSNPSMIHNVLLLFNLATVQKQISEQSKYPFSLHSKVKDTDRWSLEHIHARNETRADWDEDEIEIVKMYLTATSNTDLADYITKPRLLDPNCYRAVIKAFEGFMISISHQGSGEVVFISDKDDNEEWYDQSIMNLALLQGSKNSAFNNKLYPEKKKILSNYEGVNENNAVSFIPLCTRNVFFKHYSPDSLNPLIWSIEDGQNYLNHIVLAIAEFLDLEKISEDPGQMFTTLRERSV